MNAIRLALGVGMLCAAALAVRHDGVRAQTFDMKIGYASVNDPQDEASKRFVAELDQKSAGRIKGRIFPSAQLGGIQRMIEGVQLGTQEIWIGPPSFMIGLNPAFQAPDAPGLFDDVEHAHRSLTDPAFRSVFVRLAEDKGVVVTSIAIYDPTWIASIDPIRRLGDVRGKKLRIIASKVDVELMSALGATGVPMDFAEVVPALQNRTIDGVRSSIVVLGGIRAFNVVKNITYEGSGIIPIVFATSKTWLDKLPADLRQLVMDTGKAYDRIVTDICSDFRTRAEKLWRDNGASVMRLSDDDRRELAKRVGPLGDKILTENPRTKEVYDVLKASAARNRKAT
jgi:TRAP-type C4-dicarboxylate transport system substrate-binding protein